MVRRRLISAEDPALTRHHVLGTKTSTNTHLLILVFLIMLAFDGLNPVKRCTALLLRSEDTSTLGWVLVVLLMWAVLQDVQSVIYFAGRIFMNSLLSIFLSRVDVVGLKNLPANGPLILAANHSNQFVDGMCIVCSVPQRKVGILIAKKSYDNPFIGFFARAMAAVPVSRPEDAAVAGAGALLRLDPIDDAAVSMARGNAEAANATHRLVGSSSCRFRGQLAPGAKVTYTRDGGGSSTVWRVVAVESDEVCTVVRADGGRKAAASSVYDPMPTLLRADGGYRVLPRGDHGKVFGEVCAALENGACVGIFPEGGSHDRTDLLDLKPGVALMALGAKTREPVPIVPVGLSYFRGHVFRSAKVTVHFGPALLPTKAERQGHDAGGDARKEACNALLERTKKAMRDVIVPAATYEELTLVHLTRRLWVGGRESALEELEPEVRMDLDRRFAFGMQRLLQRYPSVAADARQPSWFRSRSTNKDQGKAVGVAGATDAGDGEGDSTARSLELAELVRRLRAYERELRRLGLRDSQVASLQRAPIGATLFILGHMLTMLTIALLPTVVLNAPVGLTAIVWARWKQRAALRRSEVKLNAFDVLLSEQMRFAVVAVPLLWMAYAVALRMLTPLLAQDVLTLLMAAPLASYVGVVSVESGMIALHDLRPMLARLMYDVKRVEALKAEQGALRDRVHGEIMRLVESDEVVAELYHMHGQLSTTDWERVRKRQSHEGDTPPSSPIKPPTNPGAEHDEKVTAAHGA